MNLEWYRTFLVVAKYQNYRKAADELFITQTSVFNHIRNLEGLLETNLVEQSGRNIILTDAGKYFYPIAKKTIETYQQGLYDIKNMQSSYKTKLNVAVSSYIDNYLIPKFLSIFFETEPNIDISVTVIDQNIPHAIEDNQFDVGIDRKITNTKKVQFKKVCEGKIQLAVPNLPENEQLNAEIEYFEKYRVLANNHPTYWDDLKNDIMKVYPDVNFVNISSVRATEDLIKANQGVSYLPVYIIKELNKSEIKLIEPKDISSPISFTYLIWKKDSSAIQTFLKLFEEYVTREQASIGIY